MKKYGMIMAFMLMVSVVFAGGDGDRSEDPRATNYKQVLAKIEYPQVCREKGIEGTVLVSLDINDLGEVTNYSIDKAPCCDLKNAVEEVIPEMVFSPAKDENGNAINGKLVIPINFKLTI